MFMSVSLKKQYRNYKQNNKKKLTKNNTEIINKIIKKKLTTNNTEIINKIIKKNLQKTIQKL